MSETVKMPALGESVTEGTVTRWLKAVGDEVAVDEPLLEVSTDKVDTEIPSPVAGVLEKILADEDDTVEVGADLAVIGSGAESAGGGGEGDAAPEEAPQAAAEPQPETPEAAPEPEQAAPAEESAPAPAAQATADTPEEQAPAPQQEAASGGGTDVTLPALGESVTEGTVTRWLKAVGDEIAVDEPLLEVSTDKVDTEIPSPVAGTVLEILAAEDETVEVGAVLARVGEAGAAASAPAAAPAEPEQAEPEPAKAEPEPVEPEPAKAEQPAPEPAKAEQPAPEPAKAEPAQAEPTSAPQPTAAPAPAHPSPAEAVSAPTSYVTPLVRKLANEHGVDLGSVAGTGVGGRIRKQDVLDAAEAAKAAPAAAAPAGGGAAPASTVLPVSPLRGTREKMSRLRKLVAQRMVESLQISAQLTTVIEVDVTRVARLRDRAKADFATREGAKLTYLPFFALAATEALKAYPKLNASIEGEEIVYHGAENVGIAVDTDRGLVVPVIKEAGDLNIAGFARKIADLAARTRANKAMPDELSGGTFTLTNTGSAGALFDTPILLQPQVGILGIGTIVKRPMVTKDADGAEVIAVRSMVYLALSYDHRLVDGADAGRFLSAIKNRLEEGAFESDLGL